MTSPLPCEDAVHRIGAALIEKARGRQTHCWAREHWEEILFRNIMSDPAFRVQLLRFIDVLPALPADEHIAQHLEEYLGQGSLPLPEIIKWSARHSHGQARSHLAGGAVRLALHHLAGRFMGGHSLEQAGACLEDLRARHLAVTLDLLGEVTLSEPEANRYAQRYLQVLHTLSAPVRTWDEDPVLDRVNGRAAPRLNLSVKLSALGPFLEPAAPDDAVARLVARLRPILLQAQQAGAFVCLDMEHYDLRGIILRVFKELGMDAELRQWPDFGIALQAYLRETEQDLEELIAWAEQRGTPVTVRLVRGAYWDQETITAHQQGWPCPVWSRKQETDACYERCLHRLLEAHPLVETAAATHNVRSLALVLALARQHGLEPGQYELQMLYGMADPLKEAVADMGERLRVYVPIGELVPGMAYLVRRLLENTASQSILRMSFAEQVPAEVLLRAPEEELSEPILSPHHIGLPGSVRPFANTPVRRFTQGVERERFQHALEQVRTSLGRDYPNAPEGEAESGPDALVSINPAAPHQVIGRLPAAGTPEVDRAVSIARNAFEDWREQGVEARANVLLRAAERLRDRREWMAAWAVLEAGKPWREADADVVEAIDFLEYYAHEAMRLSKGHTWAVPGEDNRIHYRPRGVTVVIPPWNFPVAIPAGMLAAALVTGNTVVFKPAPQTPVTGYHLAALFAEAGLPPGVCTLLTGCDEVIGDYLVRHPDVDLIAFTGSRAVGTRLNQLAAETGPSQHHIKRVIAEMGGQNAIIVDADADLDEAVPGILKSAFSYAGQKCSAASRVITVGKIAAPLAERLVPAARAMRMGDPDHPDTQIGPLIDEDARDRFNTAIDQGRKSAEILLQRKVDHLGEGYYAGPVIFSGVDPASMLGQEEIFGPVFSLLPAANFDEALALANDTAYALTGGIYSRLPSHIEQARHGFEVGNLYINRPITGAVVGRQPFGGYKLSGVGSKAGGPDYLLQFMHPYTVTENMMRRGFAPDD